jgi:hypothetical protein
MAQADANQDKSLAIAIAAQDNALETANVIYVTATEPLYAAANVAGLQAERAWVEEHSAADHAHALSEATAQGPYEVALATAIRTQGITYATAEKTYQDSLMNLPGGSDTVPLAKARSLSWANADLAREITAGTSDVTWTTAVAFGDKIWAGTTATTNDVLLVELARVERDLVIALAPFNQAIFIAQGAAQAAFWSAETSAATIHRTAEYLAIANYKEADNFQRAAAIAGIAIALPLPWTDYQVSLAAIERDWFVVAGRSLSFTMRAAMNSADTTYRGTANALFTTWTYDKSLAVRLHNIALAVAEYNHAVGNTGCTTTYEFAVADAAEIWQVAVAATRRAERIGVQTAARNFIDDASAANQTAALASVASAKSSAVKTAALAFSASESTADGIRRVAEAQKMLTFVASAATANKAFVRSMVDADQVFDDGLAVANGVYAVATQTALAEYKIANQSGLAAQVQTWATSHVSPWATYDAALLTALATRDATIWGAERDREIAIDNALRDLTITRSGATELCAVARIDAAAAFDIAQAQSELERAIQEVAADVAKAQVVPYASWESASADGPQPSAGPATPAPKTTPPVRKPQGGGAGKIVPGATGAPTAAGTTGADPGPKKPRVDFTQTIGGGSRAARKAQPGLLVQATSTDEELHDLAVGIMAAHPGPGMEEKDFDEVLQGLKQQRDELKGARLAAIDKELADIDKLGLDVNFDPNNVSVDIIRDLKEKGWAVSMIIDGVEYVVVADIVGGNLVVTVLKHIVTPISVQLPGQPYTTYRWEEGFRVVYRWSSKIEPGQTSPEDLLKLYRTLESVKWLLESVAEIERGKWWIGAYQGWVITYRIVPFGNAYLEFGDGNYIEGGISLAGDIALFTGLGAAAKGVQGTRLAVILHRTTMAIEGAAAGYRFYQGIGDVRRGDYGAATAHFGEAFLRLIGMSAQQITKMREAGMRRALLEAERKALTGGAARAAKYGQLWLKASLKDAIAQHAGPNYTTWITKTGKRIYENPATGRQVVVDLNGGYFRIWQPTTIGGSKGKFLDLMGKTPAPARRVKSGAIKSVELFGDDLEQWTHFLID